MSRTNSVPAIARRACLGQWAPGARLTASSSLPTYTALARKPAAGDRQH